MDVGNLTVMSSEDGAFRQGLHKIKMLAENCVNEVRNMALLLRSSMSDDLGVVAALDWQAREVSKRTGMLVDTVDENVSENLPEEYKRCVYRIVQEALNNCSKQAHAKNVRVAVRQGPNHLRVSIEDGGKGFDAGRVRGLGLVGMNERVSHVGRGVESGIRSGARHPSSSRSAAPKCIRRFGRIEWFRQRWGPVSDEERNACRPSATRAGVPQNKSRLKNRAASGAFRLLQILWRHLVSVSSQRCDHQSRFPPGISCKPMQESSLSRDSHNSRRSAATRRKWRAGKGRERSHQRIYRKGGNGIVDLVRHVQEAAARIERHSKRMLAGWNWS
jgi:hypothetical protein